MELQQVAETEDRNEKEEIISSSPDSGINESYESVQSDAPSEKAPSTEKRVQASQTVTPQNSLYPFYYKSADNRKLTLLKSLSQDSEYSLDASLFDAEGFLLEMGFAGSCDPIIPDRFLPSLLQRLSRFPETEIGSLNDRIVQSIGCFRRKEGKRRLFRNLSIGKDPQSDSTENGNLSCGNSYPLLRSNTGPAAFSFDDTSCANESTESSRYSKLIVNGSNNSSFAEDDVFPTSPIAILVSAASIDAEQEEKTPEEKDFFHFEGNDSMENPDCPIVGEETIENGELGCPSIAVENRTKEYNSTFEDLCLSQVEVLSTDSKPKELSADILSGCVTDTKQNEKCIQRKENIEWSQICTDETSHQAVSPTCSDLGDNTKPSIIKHPLRRLSGSATIYSQTFSLIHSPDIDFSDTLNNISDNGFESLEKPETSFNAESVNVDSLIDFSESSTTVSIKDDSDSLHDADELELIVPIKAEIPYSVESCSPVTVSEDTFKRCKPKYTRDDSLSNFLSSMLNTNEECLSPSSPTASQVFAFDGKVVNNNNENSNVDSSLDDDNSLKNIPSDGKAMNNNNRNSNVDSSLDDDNSLKNIPRKSSVVSSPKYVKEEFASNNNTEKEKLPNRKRRILRRMSSSLKYGDEEMFPFGAESIKDQSYSSSTFSPSVNFVHSQQPIRKTFSTPMISSCPIIYPCCCLPAVNVSPFCGCQRDHINSCDNNCWSSQWNRNVDCDQNKTQSSLPNRKYKRSYKKGRYLSCPPSLNNYDCKTCFHQQNLLKSPQILCTDSTGYSRSHPTNLYSKSYSIPRYNKGFHRCDGKTGSKECLSDPQNTESSRDAPCYCYNPSTFNLSNLHQDITSNHNCRNINPVYRSKWSSTPDVRCEYSKLQNSCEYKSCNPKSNTSEKLSREHSYRLPISRETNRHKDLIFSKSTDFCSFGLNSGKVFPKYSSQGLPSVAKDLSDKSSLSLHNATKFLPSTKTELKCQNLSPTSQHLNSDMNLKRNMPLRACKSTPILREDCDENVKYNLHSRRSSEVEENTFQNSSDSVFFQNNKREALMEKKIRVFSKFFTNLGNLTNSSSNDKVDNNHNSIDLKCRDYFPPDKTISSYLYNNQDKHLKSDECQTSSPELGKLLKILNSMEVNKASTDAELSLEENNVSDCANPIYENSVSLELKHNSQGPQHAFIPISYTSSVSMLVNEDKHENTTQNVRSSKGGRGYKSLKEGPSKENNNLRRHSLQMPFKEVSRDLEELQLSIRKAKEMRISASKELHFLQELLSKDIHENCEQVNEKNFSVPQKCKNGKSDDEDQIDKQEALADLRKNSVGESAEEESFWHEEIKRMKEENDAIWQSKMDILEKRLTSQEEELNMVQSANETLQKQLELQTSLSHSCQCRTDVVQNGVGRTDSAFEDDEDYLNHKSSLPIHSTRQECERLQEQLLEAEQRADQLNLLLNQKLIELNKLQLTLSKQTKEMIELEKSYLQLQHRLRKGTTKPMVAKLCSRTSPFNSKNLCPKPSPPATPNP